MKCTETLTIDQPGFGNGKVECEIAIGAHDRHPMSSDSRTWIARHVAHVDAWPSRCALTWEKEATDQELYRSRRPAQTTEGRSPSSDLEIPGHNSTDGGACGQTVSSAEHLATAPPNTENPTPTSTVGAAMYAPERHARIAWDNVLCYAARETHVSNPANVFRSRNREIGTYAEGAIAMMLTRAHAIGFAHGEKARASDVARERRHVLALRLISGVLQEAMNLRPRADSALAAAYVALDPDAASSRDGSGVQ